MMAFEKKLEPADLDEKQWEHAVSFFANSTGDTTTTYPREIIQSSEDRESHSIEYELNTYPLFDCEIKIFLWVSADASIKMFVNDTLVKPFSCATSTPPTVRYLTCDVTQWTEGNKTSHL